MHIFGFGKWDRDMVTYGQNDGMAVLLVIKEMQCRINVTWRRVLAIIVAVGNQ